MKYKEPTENQELAIKRELLFQEKWEGKKKYGLSDMVEEKRGEIKVLETKIEALKKENKKLKKELSDAYLEISYNKGNEQ